MPWWGWMIFGALLLGSELLAVDAGFYLVFIGIAAAITGLVELTGIGLEPWVQWILFSVISIVLMVLFRKKLYARLRGSGVGYETGPAGETVTVEQALAPGETGRMSYRGTQWTIVNDSGLPFEQGQRVRISRVDGLTLKLDKIGE
ncbi:MAG: NfeD family protein [Gammaproteobacteria bacterium]|nr:NfeD family protein [Gammaproteobacteria bacterium]MDH3449194.1 NfeD family protein [Gammaproteobacteria bacterium]